VLPLGVINDDDDDDDDDAYETKLPCRAADTAHPPSEIFQATTIVRPAGASSDQ